MKGFVITDVLKPFNLTWRVDGVASTIIGILMHDEDHFAMVGREEGSTGYPGDLLGVDLPGGGEEVGFLGVMVETLGGLLRLVV